MDGLPYRWMDGMDEGWMDRCTALSVVDVAVTEESTLTYGIHTPHYHCTKILTADEIFCYVAN